MSWFEPRVFPRGRGRQGCVISRAGPVPSSSITLRLRSAAKCVGVRCAGLSHSHRADRARRRLPYRCTEPGEKLRYKVHVRVPRLQVLLCDTHRSKRNPAQRSYTWRVIPACGSQMVLLGYTGVNCPLQTPPSFPPSQH